MTEFASLISVMGLAFTLGLVHALDADHIMAVSTLSGGRPGFKQSLNFCSRWALGHGGALLIISLPVLVLGWTIPESLSHLAEQSVGVILIVLGFWVYIDIRRRGLHVHFHQHNDKPAHAHWHVHSKPAVHSHHHQHSATMIGMVHGIAGSAPLLALLPMSQLQSGWLALAYVLVFGMGVVISMLIFGGMLGQVFVLLSTRAEKLVQTFRGLIASGSIFYGLYLVSGAIR